MLTIRAKRALRHPNHRHHGRAYRGGLRRYCHNAAVPNGPCGLSRLEQERILAEQLPSPTFQSRNIWRILNRDALQVAGVRDKTPRYANVRCIGLEEDAQQVNEGRCCS